MGDYKSSFGGFSIEQKRKDLEINPMFDVEKIESASDEEIVALHEFYFEAMNKSMMHILGESMYDDDYGF